MRHITLQAYRHLHAGMESVVHQWTVRNTLKYFSITTSIRETGIGWKTPASNSVAAIPVAVT